MPVSVTPPKNIIEGVRYPVALKVAETLKRGRRYFGSSAASLSHQAFNPDWKDKGIDPALAKVGLEGERETTVLLKKWMEDKPNVVLCDSVHIRGWGKEEVVDEEMGLIDGGDTDHILLIGDDVILVDTKRWKKGKYTVGDDGKVLRSGKPFPGGDVHMREAIYMWLDYLDEDAALSGIIFINNYGAEVFRNRNWYECEEAPYKLLDYGVKFKEWEFSKDKNKADKKPKDEESRFIEFLNTRWEKTSDYDRNHINSTLVSQVVVNTVKPYDPRDRVFSKEALASFK